MQYVERERPEPR